MNKIDTSKPSMPLELIPKIMEQRFYLSKLELMKKRTSDIQTIFNPEQFATCRVCGRTGSVLHPITNVKDGSIINECKCIKSSFYVVYDGDSVFNEWKNAKLCIYYSY